MRNHWKVLRVKPGSTSAQIRGAYLSAMQSAHPDKGGSTEQAAIVNQAYEVLGNEESQCVGQDREQAEQVDPHGQEYGIPADRKQPAGDQRSAVRRIYTDAPGVAHLRLRNKGPRQRCQQQRPAKHAQ